jgi:lysozyme
MNRTLGCDVSEWSEKIDFEKMKAAGASFCYAKASQVRVDGLFKTYWPSMQQAGLLRGAFHYLDWCESELIQAKLFTDTLGGDVGELPPMLDLEEDPTPYKLTPALVQGKVWNWLQAVEKATGRVPIIYCGAYFWTQWMTSNPGWLKYPFWLAWYSSESYINFVSLIKGWHHGAPKPWKDWTIWQDMGNSNGPQFGTQALSLDRDWFNGDLDALKSFANGQNISTAPAPPLYPTYKVTSGSAPYVHTQASALSAVLGYIPAGTVVSIDTVAGAYGHMQPIAGFPSGGWVYMSYLQKQ